jgi:hypothetical protein
MISEGRVTACYEGERSPTPHKTRADGGGLGEIWGSNQGRFGAQHSQLQDEYAARNPSHIENMHIRGHLHI